MWEIQKTERQSHNHADMNKNIPTDITFQPLPAVWLMERHSRHFTQFDVHYFDMFSFEYLLSHS